MTKRTTPRRVKAVAHGIRMADLPAGLSEQEVWFLPRTRAAYDAMVEQMAKACFKNVSHKLTWQTATESTRQFYRECLIAALKSIGITRPRE